MKYCSGSNLVAITNEGKFKSLQNKRYQQRGLLPALAMMSLTLDRRYPVLLLSQL